MPDEKPEFALQGRKLAVAVIRQVMQRPEMHDQDIAIDPLQFQKDGKAFRKLDDSPKTNMCGSVGCLVGWAEVFAMPDRLLQPLYDFFKNKEYNALQVGTRTAYSFSEAIYFTSANETQATYRADVAYAAQALGVGYGELNDSVYDELGKTKAINNFMHLTGLKRTDPEFVDIDWSRLED